VVLQTRERGPEPIGEVRLRDLFKEACEATKLDRSSRKGNLLRTTRNRFGLRDGSGQSHAQPTLVVGRHRAWPITAYATEVLEWLGTAQERGGSAGLVRGGPELLAAQLASRTRASCDAVPGSGR
jgi:hypothetical protein